ncbi:DUF2971 domain-containing protein [Acinetobacter sp. NIPH 2100]|uniref:DUF2971 domain-containing protein n=1 Tax=Acinetobacter sp. NIPH 2100 TaxID=1217708 RepID=UPI0002D097D4|nr:DUF2971 domain-containing protein [Acinetobacter sp. NIPH 2100]ENX41559.1 hypothetical protein F887_01955 [Acinetobacter sp. NIPH 2100]
MKLWKFMDLIKFLNLVLTEQLHFQRINSFKDTYEGYDQYFYKNELSKVFPGEQDQLKKLSEAIRFNSYVSCWHSNEYESAAMWDLYASKNGSIAIESNLEALKESILEHPEMMFEFNNVTYIDYNKHEKTKASQQIDEIFRCQFYKRKSFKHENEYRVILRPFNNKNNKGILNIVTIARNQSLEVIRSTPVTMKAPVDIKKLIKKIYISPDTSEWETKTIISLLERINLDIEIVKSELYEII